MVTFSQILSGIYAELSTQSVLFFRYRLGKQSSSALIDFAFFRLRLRDSSWWVAQPPCKIYKVLYARICTLWLFSRILGILRQSEVKNGLRFAPMSLTGDIGMLSHWNSWEEDDIILIIQSRLALSLRSGKLQPSVEWPSRSPIEDIFKLRNLDQIIGLICEFRIADLRESIVF